MTEVEARALYLSGLKPTTLVLLMQDKLIGQQQTKIKDLERRAALAKHHPSTPSGMKPPYLKSSATLKSNNNRKPKGGHRPPPDKIDHTQPHTLDRCPQCHNPLPPSSETRERYTQEIPIIEPETTRHIIHRYWCGVCKKIVEPTVTEALPKSPIGLRTVIYMAWLHYRLAITFDKIIQLLNLSAHFKISTGGLFSSWSRLALTLQPVYNRIGLNARWSAVLHADETSWRVNGRTHWLWCFTNKDLVYYVIDRCRGSPVVLKVLGKFFAGILITDFFSSYNLIIALAKQKCLAHLLRELVRVDLFDFSPQWKQFRRQLKRLLLDAFRLARQRATISQKLLGHRKKLLRERLTLLCSLPYDNENAERLRQRLLRHQDEILTFLDHPDVAPDNNHAERQMVPAAVLRKISYGNRSQQGAAVQATLMSVFRTLELRGYDPVFSLEHMVKEHLRTGKPPSLPPALPRKSMTGVPEKIAVGTR